MWKPELLPHLKRLRMEHKLTLEMGDQEPAEKSRGFHSCGSRNPENALDHEQGFSATC
jgi:hypothetical protein